MKCGPLFGARSGERVYARKQEPCAGVTLSGSTRIRTKHGEREGANNANATASAT